MDVIGLTPVGTVAVVLSILAACLTVSAISVAFCGRLRRAGRIALLVCLCLAGMTVASLLVSSEVVGPPV